MMNNKDLQIQVKLFLACKKEDIWVEFQRMIDIRIFSSKGRNIIIGRPIEHGGKMGSYSLADWKLFKKTSQRILKGKRYPWESQRYGLLIHFEILYLERIMRNIVEQFKMTLR